MRQKSFNSVFRIPQKASLSGMCVFHILNRHSRLLQLWIRHLRVTHPVCACSQGRGQCPIWHRRCGVQPMGWPVCRMACHHHMHQQHPHRTLCLQRTVCTECVRWAVRKRVARRSRQAHTSSTRLRAIRCLPLRSSLHSLRPKKRSNRRPRLISVGGSLQRMLAKTTTPVHLSATSMNKSPMQAS